MGSFALKISKPTRNGMKKNNTNETGKTSEISIKRLKNCLLKFIQSSHWKIKMIDPHFDSHFDPHILIDLTILFMYFQKGAY